MKFARLFAIALALAAACLPVRAHAAVPANFACTQEQQQSQVSMSANARVPSSFELSGFNFGAGSPTNTNTGMEMGKSSTSMLTVQIADSAAFVSFFQLATRAQRIPQCTLNYGLPGHMSKFLFQNLIPTNVRLIYSTGPNAPAAPIVEVSFTYQAVRWSTTANRVGAPDMWQTIGTP